MTRTSEPRTPRKIHHYRPRRVNIAKLRNKPVRLITVTPRVIYVQEPYYGQMLCGDKTVESRPYYPRFHDLLPGQCVKFCHRSSGDSFLVRITHKRVHRNFVTMLRTETIQACLPQHDADDLQRAVNTYRSFRQGTYQLFEKKYGVISLRFNHVEENTPTNDKFVWAEYDTNSLCSIFSAVKRVCPVSKVTC